MVKWDWRCKCGEIIFKEKTDVKYNLYTGGNCMCVLIQEWKENGKDRYIFGDFWQDAKTLKTVIGDIWFINDIKKLKLNTFYLSGEWDKIAKLFTQQGVKVELFYKEQKK